MVPLLDLFGFSAPEDPKRTQREPKENPKRTQRGENLKFRGEPEKKIEKIVKRHPF
jgi:hypothetical protein